MKCFQTLEMGKHNKKVLFLLSGAYMNIRFFWVFTKIFELSGYYCVTYAYNKDVLSPDIGRTNISIQAISKDILARINRLKGSGYKSFSIFGTSLGSVMALIVADESPDISKIILNTVGVDMAETIWTWDSVFPGFKKNILKQGIILPELKVMWQNITPINHINNLANKEILIYLSEKDEVIPINLGLQLIKAFDANNYKYTLIINKHLYHSFTCIYNLFNIKTYLKFLNA